MDVDQKHREIVKYLSSAPIFVELTKEALLDIAMIAEDKSFLKGELLAEEGETGDSMFVIISGKVVVTKKNDFGDEIELARLGAGAHLGEMAILSNIPRTATLTALSDLKTLEINKNDFEEILITHPQTSLGIIRELIRRLDESDARIRKQASER